MSYAIVFSSKTGNTRLLADPNWVNKLQSGNAAKIHRCVRCNKKCLGGLIAHQGTRCVYDALNAKEQGSI